MPNDVRRLIEQFAFLVPIALAPIIIALMWAQHQARRYERIYRHTEERCVAYPLLVQLAD